VVWVAALARLTSTTDSSPMRTRATSIRRFTTFPPRDCGPDRTAGVSMNQARRANRDARWFLGLLRCGYAAGLAGSARRDPLRSTRPPQKLVGRAAIRRPSESTGAPVTGRRAANSPLPTSPAEAVGAKAQRPAVPPDRSCPLVPARARSCPLVPARARSCPLVPVGIRSVLPAVCSPGSPRSRSGTPAGNAGDTGPPRRRKLGASTIGQGGGRSAPAGGPAAS
jgi:hypothetical protein